MKVLTPAIGVSSPQRERRRVDLRARLAPWLFAIAAALGAGGAARGQNLERGKEINATCAGCHGELGQGGKRGEYPRLAGVTLTHMDLAGLLAVALSLFMAALYLVFRGVSWLFGEKSGWHRLEQDFACESDDRAWTHRGETIRVGPVRFRRCVSAAIRTEGLYLQAMAIFRYRPIRIPWERMSGFAPDSIYNRPAMRFSAGSCTIAVEMHLYAAMYPHVAQAVARTAPG